ncbi:MAG: sensor histidine kinase [Acidimicrobiales bacterium]
MFENVSFRSNLSVALGLPILVSVLIAVVAVATGAPAGVIIVAGVTTVASVAAAVLLRRQLLSQLDSVAAAADRVATDDLPRLISSTGGDGAQPVVLEGAGDDELGRIIASLNSIEQTAASAVATQHKVIRQGLSELVVNLVRRNQSLLDRQIGYIDNLEANEEDPDRLQELFGIDHLATRMRRNAESLLVLAGSEPPRRKGGPVSVTELVRVAMSEIEDYRNVRIGRIDEGEIGAQAAFDLAHVLSELLENATQFSPPETDVEIRGMSQPDGAYLLSVADHGIGMNDEQLTAFNALLAEPPELDLHLSRSLGFIVIGRLAQRLDLRVELAHSSGGGVTALLLVPAPLLCGGAASVADAPAVSAPPPGPQVAHDVLEAIPVPDPVPVDAAPAAALPFDLPFDLPEASGWAPTAVPERGAADLGRRSAVEDPRSAPVGDTRPAAAPAADPARSAALARLLGAPAPPPSPPVSAPQASPEIPPVAAPEPVPTPPVETAPPALTPPANLDEAVPSGDRFDAAIDALLGGATPPPGAIPARGSGALVKRDRSRSQAPESEGRRIPDASQPSTTVSSRSPEELRAMLARYRSGRDQKGGAPSHATTPINEPTTSNESGGPA